MYPSDLTRLIKLCYRSVWCACIFLGTFNAECRSQNLIADPGFENYTACPDHFTLVTNPPQPLTASWYIPTLGTSDYFNSCSIGTTVSVPQNFFGNQNPLTGNGYSGIFVFSNSNTNYREYVETQLISPLVAGQTYEVGFYVSLSDSSDVYIKEIGAHLSGFSLEGNFTSILPFIPQILNSSGYLADKQNWMLIKDYYTANGGEQFMTIGNFKSDAALDLSIFNGLNPDAVSYYYVDSAFVIPCVPFNAGSDDLVVLCSNDEPVHLSSYLSAADTGGVWHDASGNVVQDLFNPSHDAPGIFYYAGGDGSCADSAKIEVSIQNTGDAGEDGTTNICIVTNLFDALNGTPNTGGQWYDPDGNAFTNPFDPAVDMQGTYVYVVSNGICRDTAFLEVTVNHPFDISFVSDIHDACAPATANFSIVNPGIDLQSVNWNFGDGSLDFSNNVSHLFPDTGCYDIEVSAITTGGCASDTLVEDAICVLPSPVATFSFIPSNPTLDSALVSFSNKSANADAYQWNIENLFFSSEKDLRYQFPPIAGTYRICLVASNNYGCSDTSCKMIAFTYGPTTLIVPSAFTPNGDGINDLFKVYGKWMQSISLKIFNRWGNVVFETTDWNEGWDGNFKGRKETEGVYVFFVDALFLDGNHVKRQGNLTLLR